MSDPISTMSAVAIPQAYELAMQRHQAGNLSEAEALYRQILATQPNHAGAMHLLGVIAHQNGDHDLAIELIRKAIALQPANAAAYCNIAGAYRAKGEADAAIVALRQALALNTNIPVAHNNLGIVLAEQGRFEEAVAAYHRALQLQPDYADACNNLGIALKEQGRHEQAIASYRRALELNPGFAEAHNNLGLALSKLDDLDQAVAEYHRALELRPGYAEALSNLGNALRAQGKLDEAVVEFQSSIKVRPDSAEAHNNLGNAFKDQGRLDEAIAEYRLARQLKPSHAAAHSNLILSLHLHPEQDGQIIAGEQVHWNRQFHDPVRPFIQPHGNDRDPDRRLRIGYVSPDLRDHVVGRNMLPLFRSHDHREFEVLCYSGVIKPDTTTEEFRRHADGWRSTVGVSDDRLADIIRQDRVDILVDLAQHTGENRLPVFARQPAPVQVSFAGYPESTGVEAIRYRIGDRWLEGGRQMQDGTAVRSHPATCDLHPASGLYLLDSFWCYDPCGMTIGVHPLPAEKNGYLTFGSLNNFGKINEPVLRLWAKILRAVANSRLILLSTLGSHRQRTLELLGHEGIESSRVEFQLMQSREAYLESYHRLDIALDPFPYNGHTTSLDALWMGVPVVSLAGRRAVSRAGLSQMSNLGLPELVAFSEDEYVRIAIALSHDKTRLRDLRATLRARMENSVLMNALHFTREIEKAFRSMWREWCAENP